MPATNTAAPWRRRRRQRRQGSRPPARAAPQGLRGRTGRRRRLRVQQASAATPGTQCEPGAAPDQSMANIGAVAMRSQRPRRPTAVGRQSSYFGTHVLATTWRWPRHGRRHRPPRVHATARVRRRSCCFSARASTGDPRKPPFMGGGRRPQAVDHERLLLGSLTNFCCELDGMRIAAACPGFASAGLCRASVGWDAGIARSLLWAGPRYEGAPPHAVGGEDDAAANRCEKTRSARAARLG